MNVSADNKWEKVVLNEVCEFISRGISPAYTEDDGVVVINQKCIRDNRINLELARLTNPDKKKITEQKYLKEFDILVNSTGVGTLGRVAQVKELESPMTVDSHVTIVRPKLAIDAEFLGYNLFMQQRNIEHLAKGSTGQTELSRIDLGEKIEVLLPPIQEQKAIANILTSLDEKIELNNQMNKTLEEMAQALFKRWFVDFEFPNEDGEPYKSSGGEMVDSELGMIPKGWGVELLGNICNVKGGKRLPKGIALMTQKNNHPYIRVRDMNNAEYLLLNSDYEYVDDQTQKGIERYIVSEGDVIISIVGTIGLVSKVHKSLDGANLTENCVKITGVEQVSAEYMYLWLVSKYGQDTIKKVTVGAVQAKLPIKNIQSINTLIPKEDKMMDFQRVIQSLNRQMQNNLEENQILIEKRETLLPKLMSGEIRVTDMQN